MKRSKTDGMGRRVGRVPAVAGRPRKAGARRIARDLAAAGLLVTLFGLVAGPAHAVPPLKGRPVEILYVERKVEHLPPLNNEEPIPDDLGRAGAELGIKDSNASGRFVGVALEMKSVVVAPGADIRSAVTAALGSDKVRFVAVNAPADDLLAIADMPATHDAAVLNLGATDTRLRDADCRANVLHTSASRAMLADALMQFLVFKRWQKILLVTGPHPADKDYADALRRSAKKFGAKIVGEASYDAQGGDIRDTALREFALVTRGAAHDVVAVADEENEFGTSLPYNTDLPRPVVGTQGLTPAAWGRPVEAWAAAQLQGRFKKLAGRDMRPTDYAGWMATHAVGEAAVQLKSADPSAIHDLLMSPSFEVGGFKGRSLSFRAWDGQLREPIFDLWPGAVVATAPLDGFLHPRTDLDSLGIDEPESRCTSRRGQPRT